MVAVALGRMKRRASEAVDVLVELLPDEDVTGHAVIALGKLKNPRSGEAIAALQNHRKTWVRAEVKKALVRIDKNAARQSWSCDPRLPTATEA
jgi:HEAT repeat protein